MSVSDQVQINESAIHMLMDRDFKRHPGCLLQYKVDGRTIIHCYDGPHIIKVVRNNFEVKDIKHNINERWSVSNSQTFGGEQTASWDDVRCLFDHDRQGCHRMLPKITEEHMKPTKLKMKVSVATQVFSQTYGTVMLECADKQRIPAKSKATGQLLLFFNDFFDSINGGGPAQEGSLKGSITEDSIHFVFWEYALTVLSKMHFIDKATGKVNSRSTVLNKMESTIKGYQEITRICLNKNIELVSLRYFLIHLSPFVFCGVLYVRTFILKAYRGYLHFAESKKNLVLIAICENRCQIIKWSEGHAYYLAVDLCIQDFCIVNRVFSDFHRFF